uniref:Ion_trans_2 domain-containing protein n=1 Tax=Rhabditophanes sp. KR3021 TaxID=114890 RepID=A0AC35TTH2_9BILA
MFGRKLSTAEDPNIFLGSTTRLNLPNRKNTLKQYHSSWYLKLKAFYDKYKLKTIAPFILLFLYSIIGAGIFYLIESDNEIALKQKEETFMEGLRNETFTRLKYIMNDEVISENSKLLSAKDIFGHFENQLLILKGERKLDWDYMGALFYVGSIVTTIGYGTIHTRTTAGQALTIVYSIIGIPLVLAILSQSGKTLTQFLSDCWIKYRMRLNRQKKKLIGSIGNKNGIVETVGNDNVDVESQSPSNLDQESMISERISRTIPIWLAFLVCIIWICFSAGLFCIWESKWSYFTSFYFMVCSLTTIGLGDVILDHPHMLILMFWLVIIGLSIVSMLLSVIQIKIEEWFYDLMLQIENECRRAMEEGDTDAYKCVEQIINEQPWWARYLAPHLMSEKQEEELDVVVEKYEKEILNINNKYIQTDYFDQDDIFSTVNDDETLQKTNDALNTNAVSSYRSANESFASIDDEVESKSSSTQIASEKEDNNSIADAASLPFDVCEAQLVSKIPRIDVTNCYVETCTQYSNDLCDKSIGMSIKDDDSSMAYIKNIDCATDAIEFIDDISYTNKSIETSLMEELKEKKLKEWGTMTNFGTLEDGQTQTSIIENLDKCLSTNNLISFCDNTTDNALMPIMRAISINTEDNYFNGEDNFNEDKSQQTSITEDTKLSEMTVFYEDEINLMKEKLDMLESAHKSASMTNISIQCDSFASPIPESKTIGIETICLPNHNVSSMTLLTSAEIMELQSSLNHPPTTQLADKVDESTEIKKEGPKKHDLIVQTDDSYLKIARRLNEIRTQKGTSLKIVSAQPLSMRDVETQNKQSQGYIPPSERREYVRELKNKFRSSRSDNKDRSNTTLSKMKLSKSCQSREEDVLAATSTFKEVDNPLTITNRRKTLQTQKSLVPDRVHFSNETLDAPIDAVIEELIVPSSVLSYRRSSNLSAISSCGTDSYNSKAMTRSSSNCSLKSSLDDVTRERSRSIQQGKVGEYIKKHEIGISNPAIDRRNSLVTIVDMRDKSC